MIIFFLGLFYLDEQDDLIIKKENINPNVLINKNVEVEKKKNYYKEKLLSNLNKGGKENHCKKKEVVNKMNLTI